MSNDSFTRSITSTFATSPISPLKSNSQSSRIIRETSPFYRQIPKFSNVRFRSINAKNPRTKENKKKKKKKKIECENHRRRFQFHFALPRKIAGKTIKITSAVRSIVRAKLVNVRHETPCTRGKHPSLSLDAESKGRSWKLATFLERKGCQLHGGSTRLALNSAVRELSAGFSNSVSNSVPSARPATRPPALSRHIRVFVCTRVYPHAVYVCASRAASRPTRHAYAATTFCIKSFVYGPRRFIGRATMYAAGMRRGLLDLGSRNTTVAEGGLNRGVESRQVVHRVQTSRGKNSMWVSGEGKPGFLTRLFLISSRRMTNRSFACNTFTGKVRDGIQILRGEI